MYCFVVEVVWVVYLLLSRFVRVDIHIDDYFKSLGFNLNLVLELSKCKTIKIL